MLLTAGVVLLSLFSFLMAFFVLSRNYSHSVNRSFGIFALLTSVWMLANYIGANFKAHLYARYFIYIDFTVGPTLTYSFWWLTKAFLIQARPETRRRQNYIAILFLAMVIGAAFSTLLPQFVVVETVAQHIKIIYGPYFDLYSAVTIFGITLAFYNLVSASKRSIGRPKAQIRAMLIGLVIFSVSLASANLIVPELTDSVSINLLVGNLSFIGIFAFEALTFYAIVRHRLFDLRLALTRTVGFLLTVGFVAGIYSLLIIGIGIPSIHGGKVSLIRDSSQIFLLVPPTIFVALTFHSIQQYIARITRQIFYKDSYDLRETLDNLSDTLISNNDIEKIMNSSLAVINEAIKSAHAYFIVLNEKGELYSELSLKRDNIPDTSPLLQEVKHLRKQILVKDEMPAGSWPKQLEDQDITVLLRLGSANNLVGALFFGPKQDGMIYAEQDIDLLTIGAKNLAVALENAKKYEQISTFADTLHREVIKATASLRKANQKLKTLDALKDDFISMASHQLRTPASSVHEAIQMLNQDKISPAERKHLTVLAEASSEHLVSVVVDMLSIARIEAGHFNVDKTVNSIQELVSRALEELTVIAEGKEIKLKFNVPKTATDALIDRAKINEAITNYIENAIKYSQEKSEVLIDLKKEDRRIIFEVTDTGIGVPEPERKNLFTKFYRAKNARTEHPDGNGIGLFVVKTIIESHGGKVYYKPLAKGSLFGFWISSK